jgi:hypothetical protein
VSTHDSTICSPWSRTLLVKPRSGCSDSRDVMVDFSPSSSFDDGETPSISHRSFAFEVKPRLEDPEKISDKCEALAMTAKVNKRGCLLLSRRARAVAYACKYMDVLELIKGSSDNMEDFRRGMDGVGDAVIKALVNAQSLISRCCEAGWVGRVIGLTNWVEMFSAADQMLVSSADSYGVHVNAVGGYFAGMHAHMEAVYSCVLNEFGLARMHLAAVLFPHLDSWATLEECLSTAKNIALDFNLTKEEFAAEISNPEFEKAVTITREKRHKTTEGSFPASICQVFYHIFFRHMYFCFIANISFRCCNMFSFLFLHFKRYT